MTEVSAKADRCKRLLDDPDLKQAFQDVRDALHRKFEQCATNDAESMVDIRKRLHLLDSVEENLRLAIRDGELADFRANEQERQWLGDLWKSKRSQWRTASGT